MYTTLMVTPQGANENWMVSLGRRQNAGLVTGYAPTGRGGYGILALCGKPINADLIAAVIGNKAHGTDFPSSTPRPWIYSDRDGGVIVGADGTAVVQGMPETTARQIIATVCKSDTEHSKIY